MTAQPHPDPERLTAYLLGTLPAPENAAVAAHLAACDDCRTKAAGFDSTAAPAAATVTSPGSGPKKIVAGHELHRELARGGLGVVYLVYHPHLLDYRAIKRPLLRPGIERDQVLARFRREVQAVGSLRHDHVIRAHDAGADADGPYLVMEYLDGEPLSRLVKLRGPLPVEQACALVRQAALGLQAAHERGLVHRDVKPSNLMLARAGAGTARVVVIDWGLVKRTSEPKGDGVTVVATALGTPDYMSPEQTRDAHSVDIRADIYSLGVTLYFLLAGKAPFHGRPDQEKLAAHQREPFGPLSRSDLPRGLPAVLKKMVEKDPARRYAAPAEVAQALQPFCAEARLFDLLERKETPPPPPVRRRRIAWLVPVAAALAAVLLLASVSLALLIWGLPSPDNKGDEKPNAETVAGLLGDGPVSPLRMKDSHPGYCSSLAFTPDGLRAVSESGGGSVYVWDLKTRDSQSWLYFLERPDKGQDVAGVVAVSPDGQHLIAAGLNAFPREMHYLSLYDQKPPYTLKEQMFANLGRMGPAIAFSPKGTQVAAVELPAPFGLTEPKIRIIDVQTRKVLQRFPCRSMVNSLAFSPDGASLLAGGDDKAVCLWRWQAQKLELSFLGHDKAVSQVAFSRNGKRVYSASNDDETVRVWNNDKDDKDLGNERRKISVRAFAEKMLCAAFWPGGRALTGHADGSVILWDLETQAELKRFTHKAVQITAVAISPDGHHALAAHSDHSVYLYRLPAPVKPR